MSKSNSMIDAVKKLRSETLAGFMDCRKALEDSNGDLESARILLRKRGLLTAQSKYGRTTNEGVISAFARDGIGALVEIKSETDFVARNEEFCKFAAKIAEAAINCDSLDDLKSTVYPGSDVPVMQELQNKISILGENISITRISKITGKGIAYYAHGTYHSGIPAGKHGALVSLSSSSDEALKFGRKLAAHVISSKPEALDISSLNASIIERERGIFTDQAFAEGKTSDVIDKIVNGKMLKYYQEVVLLEQLFVFDTKKKVSDFLEQLGISLSGYIYLSVGS